MLADDILEMERERPEELEEDQGACRFCGQIRVLHTLGGMSEEKCNEAATQLCDCFEAGQYTKKLRKKERAFEKIEDIFQDKPEEIKELLRTIIVRIVAGDVTKASINLDGKTKAGICMTAKENIKIERTETRKRSLEA